jgi:hypothetical protein
MVVKSHAHTNDPGIYFDGHGLIVQRDGDGGDTAQREGFVWFGKWLYQHVVGSDWLVQLPINMSETLALLEARPGEYRRHPTQVDPGAPDPYWKTNPDKSSRDQLTPLIAAMGVWNDQDRLARIWNARRRCYIFEMCVQGTGDIFGPELETLYKRAIGDRPDRTGEAATIAGVDARIRSSIQDPHSTSDDLNQVVHLLMGKIRSPSAALDLAAQQYATRRAVCSGCYIEQYRRAFPNDFDADEPTMRARIQIGITQGWAAECSPVLGALRWYFRVESGGCSALAELYKPALQKWLS